MPKRERVRRRHSWLEEGNARWWFGHHMWHHTWVLTDEYLVSMWHGEESNVDGEDVYPLDTLLPASVDGRKVILNEVGKEYGVGTSPPTASCASHEEARGLARDINVAIIEFENRPTDDGDHGHRSTVAALEELDVLMKRGLVTDEEYADKRTEILRRL